MVTYVLIEGIRCVVGYFGVYGSPASLRTPQKCFCLVTDPQKCFCHVTDPSEVLLWTGKGFVVPDWSGLCRGRSFNDNMVKNPFNKCLQSMHPYSHDQSLSKSK